MTNVTSFHVVDGAAYHIYSRVSLWKAPSSTPNCTLLQF